MANKILIIDDDPALLLMMSYSLKKMGYDVSGGRDGQEAMKLMPQLMPDLTILDVNLPLINGDEVAKIFKKDEKLKNLKVILMSALREGLSEKTVESGADGYFSKPFELSYLLSLAKKYCSEPPAN